MSDLNHQDFFLTENLELGTHDVTHPSQILMKNIEDNRKPLRHKKRSRLTGYGHANSFDVINCGNDQEKFVSTESDLNLYRHPSNHGDLAPRGSQKKKPFSDQKFIDKLKNKNTSSNSLVANKTSEKKPNYNLRLFSGRKQFEAELDSSDAPAQIFGDEKKAPKNLKTEPSRSEIDVGYFSMAENKREIGIDQKLVAVEQNLGVENYHTYAGHVCQADFGYKNRQEKVSGILKGIEVKSLERIEKIERNNSLHSHKTLEPGCTDKKLPPKNRDLHSLNRKDGYSKSEFNLGQNISGCE